MTEYTSPLLLMKICVVKKGGGVTILQLEPGERWWETYRGTVVHQEGTQSPGEAQTQQDVKDVAPYGVGHSHVSHAW